MKLSTRYGLVGICAYGLLTFVLHARSQPNDWPAQFDYMLGALPNVSAAVTIPYVLVAIVADQKPDLTTNTVRVLSYALVAISFIGLVGWEFIQRSSYHLVFDINDLGATVVGSLFSVVILKLVTSKHEQE